MHRWVFRPYKAIYLTILLGIAGYFYGLVPALLVVLATIDVETN